jgi:ABC-type multidrug transport system ATPase subunit
MKPTKGGIKINGKISALIEVGAGFHQDLTGRENIFLNGLILGMTRQEIKQKFDEIVHFSGLEDFIDTPVKRYSSGMYARLGFSVAAHVDPDILLVDEVLSVGDWPFQRKCVQKMEGLIQKGATVIFVSHNLSMVTKLCDRCLLLERGKIASEGSSNEVVRYYLQSGLEEKEKEEGTKDLRIVRTRLLRNGQEDIKFFAGEKVTVEVTLTSRKNLRDLALIIFLSDGDYYRIFETSTEMLGQGDLLMGEGETKVVLIDLLMNLGMGTYYMGAVVVDKTEIRNQYDRKDPVATFYIDGRDSVRGVVDLSPVLIDIRKEDGKDEHEKRDAGMKV